MKSYIVGYVIKVNRNERYLERVVDAKNAKEARKKFEESYGEYAENGGRVKPHPFHLTVTLMREERAMTKTYNVTVEVRTMITVPMPVEEGEQEDGQTMEYEAAAKVYAALANGEFKDLYEEEIEEAVMFMNPDEYNTEIIAVEESEEE